MGGRRAAVAAILGLSLAAPGLAAADSPHDTLRLAIDKTAAAKTARIALKQSTKSDARTFETSTAGTLARGDQDLTNRGDGGDSRRVAVGAEVYERRPNTADTSWRRSSRSAPAQDTAFGPLALRDGTTLGDPKLYRSVSEAGTETLPQGQARKLVAELDMAAVAAAMQLSGADQARLAKMSATATVWVGGDGRIARHLLTLLVPTSSGSTTFETTLDLSDLDAPLVITKP